MKKVFLAVGSFVLVFSMYACSTDDYQADDNAKVETNGYGVKEKQEQEATGSTPMPEPAGLHQLKVNPDGGGSGGGTGGGGGSSDGDPTPPTPPKPPTPPTPPKGSGGSSGGVGGEPKHDFNHKDEVEPEFR